MLVSKCPLVFLPLYLTIPPIISRTVFFLPGIDEVVALLHNPWTWLVLTGQVCMPSEPFLPYLLHTQISSAPFIQALPILHLGCHFLSLSPVKILLIPRGPVQVPPAPGGLFI